MKSRSWRSASSTCVRTRLHSHSKMGPSLYGTHLSSLPPLRTPARPSPDSRTPPLREHSATRPDRPRSMARETSRRIYRGRIIGCRSREACGPGA
ncbi:hypothetical protein OH77DRAFT_494781 [Trametes cingulata]|nr:hypothetical protein OH77DRAFT_494781 [Trametes cingulata]